MPNDYANPDDTGMWQLPTLDRPSFKRLSPTDKPPPHGELAAWERELIDIVFRPAGDESAVIAHDRKERELCDLFTTFSANDARLVHLRLANPRKDDAVALAFHRLIAVRRIRLLAHLAGARRREALAGSSR